MKRKQKKPYHSPPEDDLRVDIDWGSSGIWTRDLKMRHYSDLKLPDWLVDRFRYWIGWYNSQQPERVSETLDSELFDAYGLSLAVDLKRVVGERRRVFYVGRKKEIVLVDERRVRESVPPE